MQVAVALEAHSWAKADRRLREENDELSRRLTALERGVGGLHARPNAFSDRGHQGSDEEGDLDGLLDQVGHAVPAVRVVRAPDGSRRAASEGLLDWHARPFQDGGCSQGVDMPALHEDQLEQASRLLLASRPWPWPGMPSEATRDVCMGPQAPRLGAQCKPAQQAGEPVQSSLRPHPDAVQC